MISNNIHPEVKGFGLNVDINHFDEAQINLIVNYLKKLKVNWVRTEIDFLKYQDPIRFKHLQTFFQLCKKENIAVVGLLSQFVAGNLKSLFFSNRYHKHILSYIDEYLEFVKLTVKNLDNEVSYWEVWNEENFRRFWIGRPDAKEYTFFLSLVSQIIRDQNPKNKIIFGGITGNDVTPIIPLPRSLVQYKGFISEAISHGAGKHVDCFAFHPYILDCYFSFRKPEAVLGIVKKRIIETREAYKDYNLIISEFGISSDTAAFINTDDVAYIYSELIKFTEKLDIPICIYALIDLDAMHFSNLNPERGFGFLDPSLQPKSLYNSYLKTIYG